MPVGIGYDVHRFGKGRRLVLCGVEFEDTDGLVGHSDADVAAHAIMDALLGAAALGDIGQHFPPTDDRYSAAEPWPHGRPVDLWLWNERCLVSIIKRRNRPLGAQMRLEVINQRRAFQQRRLELSHLGHAASPRVTISTPSSAP